MPYQLKNPQKIYFVIKTILDFFFSLQGIALSLVPFLIICLISFIDDPGNPFFLQKRLGRNLKPFTIIKFRTMKKNAIDENLPAKLIDDEEYAKVSTKWQRFLRRTSIDELPQVYNVFLFQMSFIGPRPLIPQESSVHEARKANGSIAVRPGLLGLAQEKGRHELTDKAKGYWDGEYVKHFSFHQDVKIFFTGMAKVFKGEGAK